MILPDKRITESGFANITDYSLKCPKGMKRFFAYADFTDNSHCLFSNIFAIDRADAFKIVLERFADCVNYIRGYTLYEDEN